MGFRLLRRFRSTTFSSAQNERIKKGDCVVPLVEKSGECWLD